MGKRTLTLTMGVLLLFLPILPVAAAFHYGAKAAELPSRHQEGAPNYIHTEEIYRNESELHYEFSIPEAKYLAVLLSMSGCCPSFEDGDALSATVTSPNGKSYPITVEIGEECHSAWGCDESTRGFEPDYPNGKDWIILVNPPAGIYKIIIRPSDELEEIPPALAAAGAIIWQKRENDAILLGDNIWWYYSDGKKEFKEDAGYFGWSDAVPRIVALSVVAVLGWAGAVFLLVQARYRIRGK